MDVDLVDMGPDDTDHIPEPSLAASVVPKATRTRILIVDDHPVFCDGLQALLERSPHLEVIGQAHSSGDAISLVHQLGPDIILLDIGLDDNTINGLDLVHRLRRIRPEVKIAVLTGQAERDHLMQALRLGVYAFLEKDMPGPALLAAIEQVRHGERVLPKPEHLTAALSELRQIIQERDRTHSGLTEQELEMLRLAASGHNYKEIGRHEFVSEITVKRRMQAIYRKLGVNSKAQAVAKAMHSGFI